MKVVPLIYHQMISYLTSAGKIDLLSSQLADWQCYQLSVHEHEKNESSYNPALETQTSEYQLQLAQARAEDRDRLAVDPLESIFLDGLDKTTYVSSLLSNGEKEQIQQVLLRNMDVFTWTHSNMAGINPVHASHKLNAIPSVRPVRQKVRRFHPDRHQVIQAEVDNHLKARFIMEIKYPKRLANVVVVPKKR